MRILGLDLGTKTLGIAISDKTETIASSLNTIRFGENNYEEAFLSLDKVIDEYGVNLIVLGLPKNMNNTCGDAVSRSENFKTKLEEKYNIPVLFEDERLTSVIANSVLLKADLSRKKRKEKVDGLAATIILQNYLDKRKEEKNGK